MSTERDCKYMCDPQCPACEGEAYLAEQQAAAAEGWT
jgi:hypothetical protein